MLELLISARFAVRPFRWLVALLGLVSVSGASCPRRSVVPATLAPAAFAGTPTLADIVRVVNANSAKVQQLQTNGATFTVAGYPPLRADLAWDRPQRFRLQAGTLAGRELDLGSNDQIFWIWIQRNDPPAVYYARHDQFAQSASRSIMPVPPQWIVEALGLVTLDPLVPYEGPYFRQADRAEIRTQVSTPQGVLTKVLVIDSVRGWILEQYILDARQQLQARVVASQHTYDPVFGVSLPHRIDVSLPPAQMDFTLAVSRYTLNQAVLNPDELWTPRIDGAPFVDLVDPGTSIPVTSGISAPPAAPVAPPPVAPPPAAAVQASRPWLDRIRGFR